MQIAHPVSLLQFGTRGSGRSRRRATPVRATARTSTQLAKRAGGPQDRALYTCACGTAFTASVTTSVGCPHCGTAQAW